MKSIIITTYIFVTLLFNYIIGICSEPPFNDKGYWRVIAYSTAPKYICSLGPYSRMKYKERYGLATPIILWEEDKREMSTYAVIGYEESYMFPWDPSNISDSLCWGDVRPYVYFRLTKYEGDTSFVFQCPYGEDSTLIKGKKSPHGYGINFKYDFWDLPVPQDTFIWSVNLEIHENPTDTGKVIAESGRTPFLRSPILNSLDSLNWALYYQRLDIPIAQILLNSYPYQRDLLEYLFNTFLEKDSCNMARYYGNLLINTIQYNLDPMNQVHYSENVFIEVYPTINSIIEYYYNKYIDNCCE